jgi:hypothetical protein
MIMTPKRISADLDNKNVMTDALFDAIFEDCKWIEENHCVLGFNDGRPYMLNYIFGSNTFTVIAIGRRSDEYIIELFDLLSTETIICEGFVTRTELGLAGSYKLYFRE